MARGKPTIRKQKPRKPLPKRRVKAATANTRKKSGQEVHPLTRRELKTALEQVKKNVPAWMLGDYRWAHHLHGMVAALVVKLDDVEPEMDLAHLSRIFSAGLERMLSSENPDHWRAGAKVYKQLADIRLKRRKAELEYGQVSMEIASVSNVAEKQEHVAMAQITASEDEETAEDLGLE